LVGLAIAGASKVKNLFDTFQQMTAKPNGFPKKIKGTFTSLSFEIGIKIDNPTDQEFSVSGVIATLTKVIVYYKGRLIGVSQIRISELDVPAFGSTVIPNVPIVVLNSEILRLLPLIDALNLNDLKINVAIEVLGNEYFI